jgi:hypothetical protein
MATQALIRVALDGHGVIRKHVVEQVIRLSFVGALAFVLPALVSAQRQPAPSPFWPAPADVAGGGVSDSTDAGRLAAATRSATRTLKHFACAPDFRQLSYPSASTLPTYPMDGEGAAGSGNPSAPAFSRVTRSAGTGGVGIEYLSPNTGFGFSGQGTADIYRFDRAGLDRTVCNLPSTVSVRPRLIR